MTSDSAVTVLRLVEMLGAELLVAESLGSTDAARGQARIERVTQDSRQVQEGTLFCCIPGSQVDGHSFASDAIASGAVALLVERPLGLGVAEILVPDCRAALAVAAAEISGRPSEHLAVVGVTGTNGKTTVVSMIADVINHAGRIARSIGTLTSERTTPEAPELQRMLENMLNEGVTDVAMEVSSHALALHRVDEIQFAVGVFTNLGLDHMDFHATQEQYFSAKAKLFDPGRCRDAVVYLGDQHGRLLYEASGRTIIGVSLEDAAELIVTLSGSSFLWRGAQVNLQLAGRHNVVNALLAAEACLLLDLEVSQVAAGLSAVHGVAGRFEMTQFEAFTGGGNVTAVVDYAHSPDALEQALTAARDFVASGAQLHVVFGCGGDRDRQKRPLMGEVACRLADQVILTSDNPRSEDPALILQEIVAGTRFSESPHELRVIEDRSAAISAALQEARAGDVVLVAGKGHERVQIFSDRTEPFDDRLVLRSLIEASMTSSETIISSTSSGEQSSSSGVDQ
ncbi:MAG: UDP-N-acetylmuramoyl-L-alanyl-D-glutamate--2,6-diaminopimelate ligase [Actinomycetes bacterium]